jgi:hypothetical protein
MERLELVRTTIDERIANHATAIARLDGWISSRTLPDGAATRSREKMDVGRYTTTPL